jgi:hypothetical protein
MTHSMTYLSERKPSRTRTRPDELRNIYWYIFFAGVQRQTLTLN